MTLFDAAGLRQAISALPSDPPSVPCAPCAHCQSLSCAGWESVSAPVAEPSLERLGTLRDERIEEPTLDEYHPQATSYWNERAPVALAYFPFNRCTVWRCAHCRRGFVQYTEYGGYYTDHRIRQIDPELIIG